MENKSKNNSVVKNILLYGLGGILSQAAGLITLPLIVRRLTSADYGAIEVITATTGYFSLLIGFNTMSGLYRYFYEAEDDEKGRRSLVSTTFLFVGLCALLMALLSLFLSPHLSLNLFGTVNMAHNIQLGFFALIPVSIYVYAMALLRIQNRAFEYILVSVTVALVYMSSVILLLGVQRIGIPGFFYSQIIANSIGILLVFVLSRKLFSLNFSLDWFKKVARYSFPLVPGAILAWSLSANNRIILNASTDSIQVAYYGLASKAAIFLTLVTQAFCYAWEPTFYGLLKQVDKIRRLLPQVLSLYTFGCLSLAIAVMTFAREIFLILAPPEYLAGIGLLGIIQLRWMFTMGVYIIDPGTAKTGKTWWVSFALAIAVLINLAANAALTPWLGLYGAVISELIGYASAMICRGIISNRMFPVQWNKKYVISSVLFYLLIAGIQTIVILSEVSTGLSFLLRLTLAFVFILFAWLMMDRQSKQTVFQELQTLRRNFQRTNDHA